MAPQYLLVNTTAAGVVLAPDGSFSLTLSPPFSMGRPGKKIKVAVQNLFFILTALPVSPAQFFLLCDFTGSSQLNSIRAQMLFHIGGVTNANQLWAVTPQQLQWHRVQLGTDNYLQRVQLRLVSQLGSSPTLGAASGVLLRFEEED
jgi:hypothetical protein